MFEAASQNFLSPNLSHPRFLHFSIIFPPSHLPITGPLKDVSRAGEAGGAEGRRGAGQSQILSKSPSQPRLFKTPLGSPSLPSLTFFPPAVASAFAYQNPKLKAYYPPQ